jgi:hypothetical protein
MPARLTTVLALILYVAPPQDAEPRTVLVQSIFYGTVMAALAVDLYTRRRRTADTAAGPNARAEP